MKVGDKVRLVRDLGCNFEDIGIAVGDEGIVDDFGIYGDILVRTQTEGVLYFRTEELEVI